MSAVFPGVAISGIEGAIEENLGGRIFVFGEVGDDFLKRFSGEKRFKEWGGQRRVEGQLYGAALFEEFRLCLAVRADEGEIAEEEVSVLP